MADSLELGRKAGRLTANLSPWGDFWAGIRRVDPTTREPLDWPLGTVLQLEFYANKSARDPEVTWPADIDGANAQWYVPRAQVLEDVIDPNNNVARLRYITPDGKELEWEAGAGKWTSA